MTRRRTVDIYCILCIIFTYNIAHSECKESTACSAKSKPCSVHNLTCVGEKVITITRAAFGYQKGCPKDRIFTDCTDENTRCCQWHDTDTIIKFSETLLSGLKQNCSSRSICTIFTSDLHEEINTSFTYTIIEYACQEPETIHIGAIIVGVLAAVNVIVIVMVIIVFFVIRRQDKRSLYIAKPKTEEHQTGEGPQYFTVESSVSLSRNNNSRGCVEGAVGGVSPVTTAIIHEQPRSRDITRSPKSTKNRGLPNRTMGSIRSNPASENLYSETTFTKDVRNSKNKWSANRDNEIEIETSEPIARRSPNKHISKIIDRPRLETPPSTLDKKPPFLKPKSDHEFLKYCAKNNPFRNKSEGLTTDRDLNSNKSKPGISKDRDKWELGVTKARDLNGERWKPVVNKDRDLNGDRWKPVVHKDRDIKGENWKPGLVKDSDLNSDKWKSGLSKDFTRDRGIPELTKPRALNDVVGKDRDLNSDRSKRESMKPGEMRGDRRTAELTIPHDSIRDNLTKDRQMDDNESQKTDVAESSDGSFVEDIDAMLRQKGISVLNEKQRCILSSRIDRMNR